MRCSLLFHDGALGIDLGDRPGVRVAGAIRSAPLDDPEDSLVKALTSPIGAPALHAVIP